MSIFQTKNKQQAVNTHYQPSKCESDSNGNFSGVEYSISNPKYFIEIS